MDHSSQLLPAPAWPENHQYENASPDLATAENNSTSSTTSLMTGSTSPVDIAWSFGCLLGRIFSKNATEVNLSCIENIPHKMQAIYKKCLSKNPLKRPSVKMLQEFLSSCSESLTSLSTQSVNKKDSGREISHEIVTGVVISEDLHENVKSQDKIITKISSSSQTSFEESNLEKPQFLENKQCGLKVKRSNRVKVKWDKMYQCQYDRDSLESLFLKYGTVTGVVIFKKNAGSAQVEFENNEAARMAITEDGGVLNNKIKVKPVWIREGSQENHGMAGDSPSFAKHCCTLCSKEYAHKQHLRRHIKSAHSSTLEALLPKKAFQCNSCSKSYGRLQYLR